MSGERLLVVDTADAMRELGAALGRVARSGDVLVLTGDLGAGKTTLAQGIAAGLGVSDRVTSPTFVISRVHDNPTGGPALLHVDAYRLASVSEVDDLDLEHDLQRGVAVVEWGEGLVDGLSASMVRVVITRSDDIDDERRIVRVDAADPRWHDVVSLLGLPEVTP
jgi:tRNA threonylcarbamoyladenosine biosynthesis protein TsaE